MENRKSLTYIIGAIIAILLLGLIFAVGSTMKNKKKLNTEKINYEKLFSEKTKVEDELTKIKSDLSVLKQQSDANEKLLSESESKIKENEKKLNVLNVENRALRANKKELEELKDSKDLLEKEYSQLKTENDRLLTQGKNLQNTINSLEAEKNNLSTQLEKEKLYNTDNFLVTATRGKKTEKYVIRASRTKKLNMTFEVPQNLTETITFKIITPTGTTINQEDKAISWYFPLVSRNYTASLSSLTGEFEQSRQVVLNYVPREKLLKGEYKIQILSNGNSIGNCRIMLK